jgi:hypothetical protein
VRTSVINRVGLAAIAGCIAVGALAVAGCGGGDDSSTTGASGASGAAGATPLSQDEFVSQANAACKEANDQVEALELPPDSAPVSDLAPVFQQGVDIQNATYDKVAALTPPSDLQADFSAYLAQAKVGIANTEKAVTAAKANDAEQVQALIQDTQDREARSDDLARSLGLDECAKDVQPQQG